MSDDIDLYSPYHDGSMQHDKDGGWVSYDDYKERIEELELAVRYEADLAQMALDSRKELEAELRQAKISEIFWRDGWHALDQDKRAVEAKLATCTKYRDAYAECDRISTHALRKAVEALEQIASHRKKCHEYDDDVGHERREFDVEDMIIMEYAARTTLAELSSVSCANLKGETDE